MPDYKQRWPIDEMAIKYHSVTFINTKVDPINALYEDLTETNGELVRDNEHYICNTWSNWHMVPIGNPNITLPSQKTQTIEVPGANGVIDISTATRGYPLFNNREGELSFIVFINDLYYTDSDYCGESWDYEWVTIKEEIASFINGQELYMILDDDPTYFYKGRFAVTWNNGSDYPSCSISYSVEPFKWAMNDGRGQKEFLYESLDKLGWVWDCFNFDHDQTVYEKEIEEVTHGSVLDVDPGTTWNDKKLTTETQLTMKNATLFGTETRYANIFHIELPVESVGVAPFKLKFFMKTQNGGPNWGFVFSMCFNGYFQTPVSLRSNQTTLTRPLNCLYDYKMAKDGQMYNWYILPENTPIMYELQVEPQRLNKDSKCYIFVSNLDYSNQSDEPGVENVGTLRLIFRRGDF